MPSTQKLHHRCSLRPHAFQALQCVSGWGICMANFSLSDKLQETCAIHFSMHLTHRWPYSRLCSTCLLPRDPPGKEESAPVINLHKEWALSKKQQPSYQQWLAQRIFSFIWSVPQVTSPLESRKESLGRAAQLAHSSKCPVYFTIAWSWHPAALWWITHLHGVPFTALYSLCHPVQP